MLQHFRALINSFVGKVLFTLLLATFALLGVGYGFRDLLLGATNANDAASVGGTKIGLNDLDRQYRRKLSDYQRRLGASFAPTAQQKQELASATLDQQVTEALYAEAARRDGIRVGDALVRKVIEAEPAFAGEDKRFDQAHFRMLLENQGLTEAAFIPQVRDDLARQLLINPIAGSAVAPRSLAEDIYRYRNEQRTAQIVSISNASATGIPAPSDADLRAYYQMHSVEFTAPEYRTFTVLSLTPELFAGEIKPTDQELRAAYDARRTEYVEPEKRKIEQVVTNDKAAADAIAKAAQPGVSLADAAKAATQAKAQPVALDFLSREEFPEALRDPVFAAAKGAIVGPIQTPLGWHVIKVTDIQPGKQVSFDEVKAKLDDQVKHDDAVDRLSDQIDKLGDKLMGGTPMEQVAAAVNAAPVKIGPIDAKGNLAPTVQAAQPKPDPAWVAAAFQLQTGETSPFQDNKSGAYFSVRLDNLTPPALWPLADVRAQIIADWTAEQRAIQTAKRADALAAKARAGAVMSEIASDAGVKMVTTPAVTRDPLASKIADMPPLPVVDALFQMTKIGDVATVKTEDGQVIARLTEIQSADPFAAGVQLQPVMRELDATMQGDELAEYRTALRQEYKVKVNPQAVETVVGQ